MINSNSDPETWECHHLLSPPVLFWMGVIWAMVTVATARLLLLLPLLVVMPENVEEQHVVTTISCTGAITSNSRVVRTTWNLVDGWEGTKLEWPRCLLLLLSTVCWMERSDTGACYFTSLQCVKWNGVIQVPVTSPLFSVWNGMERYRCLLLHLSSVCGMEWSDTDACCLTSLQCVEQNGVIQVPVASPLYKHISSMHIYNIHNNQPQNTPT